jgi:hypothetical protein
MQISQELDLVIMMNNYFHYVAIALLPGSGFVLHAVVSYNSGGDELAD